MVWRLPSGICTVTSQKRLPTEKFYRIRSLFSIQPHLPQCTWCYKVSVCVTIFIDVGTAIDNGITGHIAANGC
jgi:hypothetical protein